MKTIIVLLMLLVIASFGLCFPWSGLRRAWVDFRTRQSYDEVKFVTFDNNNAFIWTDSNEPELTIYFDANDVVQVITENCSLSEAAKMLFDRLKELSKGELKL